MAGMSLQNADGRVPETANLSPRRPRRTDVDEVAVVTFALELRALYRPETADDDPSCKGRHKGPRCYPLVYQSTCSIRSKNYAMAPA
jgi:hypothetical protein